MSAASKACQQLVTSSDDDSDLRGMRFVWNQVTTKTNIITFWIINYWITDDNSLCFAYVVCVNTVHVCAHTGNPLGTKGGVLASQQTHLTCPVSPHLHDSWNRPAFPHPQEIVQSLTISPPREYWNRKPLLRVDSCMRMRNPISEWLEKVLNPPTLW